jgi:hypothetical protein
MPSGKKPQMGAYVGNGSLGLLAARMGVKALFVCTLNGWNEDTVIPDRTALPLKADATDKGSRGGICPCTRV